MRRRPKRRRAAPPFALHPPTFPGALARPGALVLPGALALALATLLGCSSDPLGPGGKELNENRERWRAQGIVSYAFDYHFGCFCWAPGVQPVRIEVREGEVVEVTLQETGEPVDPESVPDFPTVEDLFEMIRGALERKPFRFEASYHPELGYPQNVFVDFEQYMADEEIGFTVSDFLVLGPESL